MLLNLQALRAIAAFLVVFVHLKALALAAGAAPGAFDFGNCGVDLFFVISGVIMVATTARRETTAKSFLQHRVARIVPFYWAVTLAVILVALVHPDLVGSTRVSAGEVIKSLAFIPYRKASGLIEPIVFVGWSLNYEMAFYGLFGASMLIRDRRISIGLTCMALALVTLWGFWANPRDTLGAFYSSSIVLEFAAGMLLGTVVPYLPRSRLAALLAAPALCAAFVALVAGSYLWPQLDRLAFAGVPATIVVACALVLERSGMVMRIGLLQRLGDASYATYLTHFFATQAVVKVALIAGLHSPVAAGGACVVALVAVGALGLGVHWGVERPLSRWARGWLVSEGARRSPLPPATGLVAAIAPAGLPTVNSAPAADAGCAPT